MRNDSVNTEEAARILERVESRVMARVDASIRRRRVLVGAGRGVAVVAIASLGLFLGATRPAEVETVTIASQAESDGTVSVACIALAGQDASVDLVYSSEFAPASLTEAAADCNMSVDFQVDYANAPRPEQAVDVAFSASAGIACREEDHILVYSIAAAPKDGCESGTPLRLSVP